MKCIKVVWLIVIAASVLGCGTNSKPSASSTPVGTPTANRSIPIPTNHPDPVNLPQDAGTRIALAAEVQVGVTTIYDSQYVKLDYPNGDVPITRGVCTDVVIRAFRAVGVDLQVRVHEDMQSNFSVYPRDWGLKAPDPNIDHRRVQNLTKYFERMDKQINASTDDSFKPGDVVAWQLGQWMQHIGITAVDRVPGTNRYYMIHNIGAGTQKEDTLRTFAIIGHYRW